MHFNMKNDRILALIYFVSAVFCVIAGALYLSKGGTVIALGIVMMVAGAAVLVYAVTRLRGCEPPEKTEKVEKLLKGAGSSIADDSEKFILSTPLLNYGSENIKTLVKQKRWKDLDEEKRVKYICSFVRDKIPFGFNSALVVPASKVLKEGMGTVNTKAVLLMALLRSSGIPCRLRCRMITKDYIFGAVPDFIYRAAEDSLPLTEVEALVRGEWRTLYGTALDSDLAAAVRAANSDIEGGYIGSLVAVDGFQTFVNGDDNYYNSGIKEDLGTYISPDEFYKDYPRQMNFARTAAYTIICRRLMNKSAEKLRDSLLQSEEDG